MRPLLLLAVIAPLLCSADPQPDPAVINAVAVEQMPSSSPTIGDQLTAFVTREKSNIEWGVGVLLSVGAVATFATQKRKRVLALVVKDVFYATEDAANESGDPNFNKAASALKALDAWCVAHGWRPLTPGEQAIATLKLQSIHGEEIAKAKVAAAGALGPEAA